MVNLLSVFNTKHVSSDPTSRPPREVVNARVIILALVGACAAILFGYDLGFIGSTITLPAFVKSFDMSHESAAAKTAFESNVVSVFQAGAIFGALVSAYISDKIGRRITLMVNFMIYVVGAALMTGAQGGATGKSFMYAGRVLTGWGVGASNALVPVYVAECSPAHIRGRLVGLYEVGVQFGTMCGFWIGYIVLRTTSGSVQWRLPVAVQLIPAGLSLIGFFLLKETPRFVVKSKGEEQGLLEIARLRSLPPTHPYVQSELSQIVDQLDRERLDGTGVGGLAMIKETFGRRNRKRLFFGCLVMVFFQMAGTNSVNYYSPRIFQSFGLSSASSKLFATGVYGIVRFVATLIAMCLFNDRFGRVSMLITGASIMATCMWIVGALSKSFPTIQGQVGAAQYAIIVLIFVWAVAFCFSYAGIPWVYASEIFPLRIRAFAMSICVATHWAFNLMLAKATPYMLTDIGYGTYFVFAAFTTVGAIWEFACLPETRGRSLEEMDELFAHPKWSSAARHLQSGRSTSSTSPRLEDGVIEDEDVKREIEHVDKV